MELISLQSLLTIPLNHNTDFTELADNCERFVEMLVECDDPAQKMALCVRLSACLTLLQPTLLEPVPDHVKESLTVDDLPLNVPVFEPEVDQPGRYCQLYSDTLKAPRWLRTDEGVVLM